MCGKSRRSGDTSTMKFLKKSSKRYKEYNNKEEKGVGGRAVKKDFEGNSK